MRTSRFLITSAFSCLLAITLCSFADAQPPEGGGRGGRDGGGRREDGGRGGRGGGPGGFGQRGGGPGGGGRGQRGGGPGGGRGGFTVTRAILLASDDVKDELNFDEGQDATIQAALDAYREEVQESRPDRSQFEDISEEERDELIEKMRKDRDALTKKTDDVLNALMSEEQATRLSEVLVQVQIRFGLERFLTSDENKEKLKITEDQIAAFEEAREAADEARRKLFDEMRAAFGRGREDGGDQEEGGEDPRTTIREKMEKLQKDNEAAVMAALTDDQKATLTQMKGEEFEFDPRSLFRGRGGFGGGPGGGGGRGGFGGPGGGPPGGGRGRDGGGRDGGRGGDRRGGDRGGDGGGRQRPALEDDSV